MVNINIVADKAKLGIFFVFLALLAESCENDKNDVIPDVYIEFTMDITGDILFSSLSAIGNSVIITSQTNNWGRYSAGYNYNGIIVYRTQLDGFSPEFYAYDRTCPHDYSIDESGVKINIDFIQAICPKCSTVYELSVGGVPSSGPGRYPLKNYKTIYDGRYLRVWNY